MSSERKPAELAWLIASYPKSGNTWVRLFLSSYIANKKADINGMYCMPGIERKYYNAVAGKDLEDTDFLDFIMLKSAAMYRMIREYQYEPLLIKTHDMAGSISGMPLYHPALTKGVIYLVRDPRDVVVSYARHLGISIDEMIEGLNNQNTTLSTAKNDPDFISSWFNHVKTWITSDIVENLHVYRYEDLYDAPEKCFRSILELFVDEVDEQRFQTALESTKIGNLQKQEDENGFIEATKSTKFFERGGGYGKWKDVLTPDQVYRIEESNHKLMVQLGYSLSEFNMAQSA